MSDKKKKDNLHIPAFKEYELPGLQDQFCNRSNGCVDDCSTCMFDMVNLPDFIEWFKAKTGLKIQKRGEV